MAFDLRGSGKRRLGRGLFRRALVRDGGKVLANYALPMQPPVTFHKRPRRVVDESYGDDVVIKVERAVRFKTDRFLVLF
jgi:hypothetical protein